MANQVAERIGAAVRSRPYTGANREVITLDISAGCATAPEDGDTRDELIAADAAMYAAKRAAESEAC